MASGDLVYKLLGFKEMCGERTEHECQGRLTIAVPLLSIVILATVIGGKFKGSSVQVGLLHMTVV